MLTKAALLADGCVPNPNMWIGDGWFYCPGCKVYTFHYALSHKGLSDCFEMCGECHEYHGQNQLERTGRMTTAADILEAAKDLTQRYADQMLITERALPCLPDVTDVHRSQLNALHSSIPARVYVLLQSGTVVAVLVTEQKALEDAHSIMHASGGNWGQLSHLMWRSETGVFVEVSPQDVR